MMKKQVIAAFKDAIACFFFFFHIIQNLRIQSHLHECVPIGQHQI